MPPFPFLLEICADSVESAMAAQRGGADRIELCSSLTEGGLTPSASCIKWLCHELHIGVNVLIRPRGGDFLYSQAEFEIMKQDIVFAKEAGAHGIVSGVLMADGRIDTIRTAELIALTRPLPFTFHRAFDVAADPNQALQDLIGLSVDRLLTSGQAATAPQGAELIADLILKAQGKLIIMPGGGVDEQTIGTLHSRTGAVEFHSSAKGKQPSQMTFRNPAVSMGSPSDEYTWTTVDAKRVSDIRQAALR
jgi:copper homeostasis protein